MKLALVLLLACQDSSPPTPSLRDCAAIADSLASIEVGNYAPRDRRARAVARLTAACAAADPDEAQAKCLLAARDRAAAATCMPNLPLDLDCTDVIAKVRASTKKPAQLDPAIDAQLERGYAVMTRACEDDGWPLELKKCALERGRLDGCPFDKDLRERLGKRIADTLR